MLHKIFLPQVELNMESVTIVRWLVEVGDHVAANAPILEVETQKATVEIESLTAGYIRQLAVKAGDSVGEKALLCLITDTADEPLESNAPAEPIAAGAHDISQTKASESGNVPVLAAAAGKLRAAPAARKLAKDRGVELQNIRGTGPNGRIKVEDVRAYAGEPVQTGGNGTGIETGAWIPFTPGRKALIDQMQRSLREIPQIHIARQLDVTGIMLKAEGITFTHRLVKAAAAALRAHPSLRTIIHESSTKVEPVSVAIAMDVSYGLVAPAVRNADTLSLEAIADRIRSLQQRAQNHSLTRDELSNAPFAITNLGMLGVDFFQAFVFHGQTAVLAVGRATDAPAGRKVAWFNLALDHRVVDGAAGARFLESLQQELNRA